MMPFRLFLIAVFATIAGYTLVVGANHGWDILTIFFAEIGAMTWFGQFNLDFSCFLLLSGLWVAWRNGFSPAGLVLGVVAVFGGMLFLSAYLLVVTSRSGSDITQVMLGNRRAALT